MVVFKTGGETSFTIYKLKPGEKKTVTATIPAGAKVAAQLWWKPMPDTPDNQAVKMAEAGP